ncbi:MAG: N-acetylmuramoyl-L-alanine amidase family protein [Gemmatimonadaceae bacterium]
MIVAAFMLLLQTAATTAIRRADSLPAAPSVVQINTANRQGTVAVTQLDGVSVVSGVKLAAALGGTFRMTSAGHYSLTLGDTHISFTDAVPFAGSDSTIVPLTSAPRVVGQTVYLPLYVVSELVPRFFTGFIYDTDHAQLRAFNTAARRVVQADSPSVSERRSTDSGRAQSVPGTAVAADASASDLPVRPRRGGRRLVVVDAGHGGPDNGMTGPIGGGPKIYEKNITLAVAKLVAQSLRDGGVDVLMTRTTDTLIALSDRGRIANKNHGDVFVSVHVNATGMRGREAARERGFETYFLAEAKSEDALRVEKMENEAVKFEHGVNAPKGDPLSFIINDMAQNEHLRESADLAQIIQDNFKSFHPGPSRGVQQANFAVLRGSYMPAVLVEIGFGTNPLEAAYLSDTDNERTIARSIAKSVLSYLGRYDARVGGGK